jgi:molybdopterin-containing oxidoreductase family membrane subunit
VVQEISHQPDLLFVVSIVVSIGMWLERFVIIVVSLNRDYLPSSWANYQPTFWDWALYAGTFGLFLTLFLLFTRALPLIAVAEMRELVHHESHHGSHGGGHGGHLTHDPHGKTIEDRDHSGGVKEAFYGSS